MPPFLIVIVIDVAWASIEFSNNSFMIEAGRSTTSPAAINPEIFSLRIRIGIAWLPREYFGFRRDGNRFSMRRHTKLSICTDFCFLFA